MNTVLILLSNDFKFKCLSAFHLKIRLSFGYNLITFLYTYALNDWNLKYVINFYPFLTYFKVFMILLLFFDFHFRHYLVKSY